MNENIETMDDDDVKALHRLIECLTTFSDPQYRNFRTGGEIAGLISSLEAWLNPEVDWWPFEFCASPDPDHGLSKEALDEPTRVALMHAKELLRRLDDATLAPEAS